jgi:RNA polymerase sigma factor for flagellar operon FliA
VATRTKNIPECPLVEESQKRLRTAARRAYAGQKQQIIDNDRIAELLPLVHNIVQRVVTYLKPPLSYEDLVSAGTLGLVKAARDYDPSFQAEFKTYAYIRIRGAILDELRNWSFVPANVDKQIRETLQASLEIIDRTGLTPTDTELAEKLDITIDHLYDIFESARAKHFVSIDHQAPRASGGGGKGHSSPEDAPPLGEFLAAENTSTPHDRVEKNELIEQLTEAVSNLDPRQRQIIILYYQQQLTMKQIAEVFNITEPRVSQLHASALFRLSLKLSQWKDGR